MQGVLNEDSIFHIESTCCDERAQLKYFISSIAPIKSGTTVPPLLYLAPIKVGKDVNWAIPPIDWFSKTPST